MNRLAWLILLATASILAGCGGAPSEEEAEGEATAEVHAVTVQPSALQPTLDLVGSLTPLQERTVVLSPALPGQVNQVAAREGQTVHAGDVLLTLDARTHEAELAKAQAAFDEAQANVAMLKRGALPEEIDAARQEAHSAAAAAEAQRAKLKALEPLVAKGEISNVQLDQAKSAASEAASAGAAAQARLKMLAAGTRPEMMDQANAKLAAAQAEVAAQKLAVAQCTVTSPIDGVIMELSARQGMFVDQPTVLARIADLTSLYVVVRMPSQSLGQVQEGAEASVTLQAFADRTFPAKLDRIAKEASAQTGDMNAYIAVPNPDGALQPGLSCSVQIKLPEIADALAVPVPAVADHDGKAVVTVIKDGKAHEIEVEIGVKTREVVQITKGIAAGDVVATEGGYGLPEDCPVKVVTDEPADVDKSKEPAEGAEQAPKN